MNWHERIVVDPGILVGKPVIKGSRLAVEFIVDLLAQGWSEREILKNYPGVDPRRHPCQPGLCQRRVA
jgi:uncharacterized protein (DUF433 family)